MQRESNRLELFDPPPPSDDEVPPLKGEEEEEIMFLLADAEWEEQRWMAENFGPRPGRWETEWS